MEPNRFGRKLGIGVRVASRMVQQRAAQSRATQSTPSQPGSAQPTARSATPANAARPAAPPRNYTEPARRFGEGTRRFGKAVGGPLAHAGRTLWLELTGLIFALFALFFVQYAWRVRASAVHGPDHTRFVLYGCATAIFLYFSITSFWKSARITRQRRMQ